MVIRNITNLMEIQIYKILGFKIQRALEKWAGQRLEKGSPSDVIHQSFIHAGVYFYTGCQILLGSEDSSKKMAERGFGLVAPTATNLVGKQRIKQ